VEVQPPLGAESRQRAPGENGGLLPKITPLRGTLHAELKACGKLACRCARGDLHGPYLSRRWREGGRQRLAYVKPTDLEPVQAGLAEWARLHPPAYRLRQELAALRRLLRELDGGW
jgi:hypothetical protein